MDQWHPSYGNGCIDGKQYFEADDGRGFFAHPPEIMENLGTTQVRTTEPSQEDDDSKEPEIGQVVTLKDGQKGVVKYVGAPEFSDGQKLVGVELEKWSTNTNTGTVEEYFSANPGRGYFARFSSISDWKIPDMLIEEARRLDEEDGDENNDEATIDSAKNQRQEVVPVKIGDRVITARGHSGVVRYSYIVPKRYLHCSHQHRAAIQTECSPFLLHEQIHRISSL